jgi:HJR/Mrr/RecB family endonuclease
MATLLAQIETLKQQLTQVSADLGEVKRRTWEARKTLSGAQLRAGYRQASLAVRKPVDRYPMWSTAVLTIGPVVAALATLVLLVILGLSAFVSFCLAFIVAGVALAVLSTMLRYPATEMLPKLIADERFLAQESRGKAAQLALEVATLRKQQVAIKAAIKELVDEDHRTRTLLLKCDWKAMRDDEWKQYIGEVFTALGAEVKTPKPPAGVSADYIVTYGRIRIAVIARGNVVAVANKDVQAAQTGKKEYDCDRATVIANSRLALLAIEEAEKSGCILIGVREFPSFVMGSNLELFR